MKILILSSIAVLVIAVPVVVSVILNKKRTPENCKYNCILGCTGDCNKCGIPAEQGPRR